MSTETEYKFPVKKKSVLYWVTLATVVFSIPLAWIGASMSNLQAKADDCGIRQVLSRDPASGIPAFTLEQLAECNRLRASASTYFFVACLKMLFDMASLEAMFVMSKRAVIAYAAGIGYVLIISLIFQSGFPKYVLTFYLPVAVALWWLQKTGKLT